MGEDEGRRAPSGEDDVTAAKRALRAEARAHRALRTDVIRSIPGRAWTDGVLGIDAVREARVVALYAAYGTEPPTSDLVDTLVGGGVRVLLPVLLDDRDLDWVEATSTDIPDTAPRLGVDAIATADAVVVPALLAGHDGVRLGQGGGSYDRALRRLRPGTPVVALLHDGEVRGAGVLPHEAHDVGVTHVVTPAGVAEVAAGHHLPIDPDATPELAWPAFDHRHPRRWDVALVIAAGGALGSAARWALGEAVPHGAHGFPWATFAENTTGCLLIGALMVYLLDVRPPSRYARPFLVIGVLGGYTTFSTYTVDTRSLLASGDGALALTYLFGTLVVGLLATWAGLAAARAVTGVGPRSRATVGGGSS